MLDFFPNICYRTVLYVFLAVAVLRRCVCFHHWFRFPVSSCCLLSCHQSRPLPRPRGCSFPSISPAPSPTCSGHGHAVVHSVCALVGSVLCLHVSLNGVFPHSSKLNWRITMQLQEKAMATHSSTLAWKIPWPEEPGRLQSTGSHRVGHDWSDLAAAAAAACSYKHNVDGS